MTRRLSILKKEKQEYPILVYTLYTEIRDHKPMAIIGFFHVHVFHVS